MKVGVVCYPTYGGSGVVATELGIQMAKKGHEVHFITYSQPVRSILLMKTSIITRLTYTIIRCSNINPMSSR